MIRMHPPGAAHRPGILDRMRRLGHKLALPDSAIRTTRTIRTARAARSEPERRQHDFRR